MKYFIENKVVYISAARNSEIGSKVTKIIR
jgi:hypothetical protein